jgi:hypothetical protein
MVRRQWVRSCLLVSFLILATPMGAWADTVTVISFDTGVVGQAVGNAYASSGIHFSNAQYDAFGSLPGGSPPDAIDSISNGTRPTAANPIVATFDTAASNVQITGLDVGGNGIRIDAFNGVGTLLGSDSFIGVGLGVGVSHTLSVSFAGIAKVTIYQPQDVGVISGEVDGDAFDNFTFTTPSAPSGAPLPSTAFAGLGLLVCFGTAAGVRRRMFGVAM